MPVREGRVSLYACGITAYDYCHIGHARSSIAFDVLVRVLRDTGLEVTFIRNFTDVDDKIIVRANKEGVSSEAIARKYMAAFHEDMERLFVLPADIEPLATEHIAEMIVLCEDLIAQDYAYATPSGDVYFRVRSWPEYGKLSGRSLDDLLSGARVLPGEEKEDPLDFALWKSAKPDEPWWESPWGRGRPGWHIECSAMAAKYVDMPLDIHGGGLDLVFPHHENEIAQSEAAHKKPLANIWAHNGFVQINAEKMSKSLGNFTTIRDILENWLPETLRFFLIGKHYRSPIDFSFDGMIEAERTQKRFYETLRDMKAQLESGKVKAISDKDEAAKLATLEEENAQYKKAFIEALHDDCNTAAAIGHIFTTIRLAGRVLDSKVLKNSEGGQAILRDILLQVERWEKLLGVFGTEPQVFLEQLKNIRIARKSIDTVQVEALLEKRQKARLDKDFASSDALRAELLELGVSVKDTGAGQQWDVE